MWIFWTFWGSCRALYLFLKQSYTNFKFSVTRDSKSCKKSACPLSLGCKLFFVCLLDLTRQVSGKMRFLLDSSPKHLFYARMPCIKQFRPYYFPPISSWGTGTICILNCPPQVTVWRFLIFFYWIWTTFPVICHWSKWFKCFKESLTKMPTTGERFWRFGIFNQIYTNFLTI